jgi:outer membrane receptor protein involved in Fe transport
MGISYETVKSFPKTRNLTRQFNSEGSMTADYRDFTDLQGYTFGIIGFNEPQFGERNFENFGLFVQTEYKIFENLKLDAGIRYDYNSVYQETFNPRIGMIIDPMKNLNIKLLYVTAYIQPSNFYRYENFANPFLLHIPNENLEPEKLKNYSVDVSYTFGEHYAVHLAAYVNKMENIIRAVQAPA